MTFTVEIKDVTKPAECEVEMFLDEEALNDLLSQLERLNTKGDHAHFFTNAWGGAPLSDQAVLPGSTLVNHMRVTRI